MTTVAKSDVEMRHWGPDPVEGVRKYVEKIGRGHGIGYANSKSLIEHFGHILLPGIIKSSPHMLLGTTKYRLDYRGLSESWNAKSDAEHATMMKLMAYRSITGGDAAKICNKYGFDRAIEIVQSNPYQLSLDIDGIGFERADKIAKEGGTPGEAPIRIKAALYHALQEATNDKGDIYVTRRDWIYKAEGLIGRGKAKILVENINQLIELEHVYEVLLPEKPTERVYYTRYHYKNESRLAKQLKQLSAQQVEPIQDLDERIKEYETKENIVLSDKQREAIKLVTTKPVVVITGGPGTGKTTIVRGIVSVMDHKKMSLAAFAGCAAKRLREASRRQALTIHKTLAFDPVLEKFAYDSNNQLDSELVILDETSMIDASLLNRVIQAIRTGSRLVLIGDVDQLPSIGPGAALRDIIASETVPVVFLKTIFRQAQKSRIVANAKRIIEGRSPIPAVRLNDQIEIIEHLQDPDIKDLPADVLRDYIDVEIPEPPEQTDGDEPYDIDKVACDTVVRLVRTIEKRYQKNPKNDIQILAPMNINPGGANSLNKALQAAINPLPLYPPAKPNIQIGNPKETVSVGDKVMQLRNDYTKGLYNGDIGYVTRINHYQVVVDFQDGQAPREYKLSECQDLKLAYASSIHKSQGSEFPVVILVILSHQTHMLTRSLFYTAVTRGKQLVFVVHNKDSVMKALREPRSRQTLLAQRLRGVPIKFRTGKPSSNPISPTSPAKFITLP